MKIRIDGLNTNKIINALIDKNVFIEKLTIKKKYIVFSINDEDRKKLDEVCKKYHKKYRVLKISGFKLLLSKLKLFYGTMLAIILTTSLILSFNSYIFKIHLSYVSEQDFDLNNIKDLLNKNNIVEGMKKNTYSVSQIQKLILETQDNVAGCSVSKNGGVLDIIVYPGVIKDELNNNDIISNYDAVITNIEIFAGKTEFKVGDLVKKNDILIKNDNGASGKIYGKVYFSDYLVYNENQFEKQFTGEKFEEISVGFLNKKLQKPLKINENLNYIEEKCVFNVCNNFLFPFTIIKTQYLVFEYVNTVVKFETVEEKLKSQLYNQILNNIKNISSISNVTYSIVKESNLTRIDCFAECELDLTL